MIILINWYLVEKNIVSKFSTNVAIVQDIDTVNLVKARFHG
jgi:hypothetical protein